MSRSQQRSFRCDACGYSTGKWLGFCHQCRAENSLVEVTAASTGPVPVSAAGDLERERLVSGIGELDRVLGGGFVPGSVVLLGGEPGVGKSTLLVQVAAAVARTGPRVLVVSAEESVAQVGRRAKRVGADHDGVLLLAEHDIESVIATVEETRPGLVIVDSIQTVSSGDVDSPAGSVGQVKACGARLIAAARRLDVPTVLVGHVTKEGILAGPRLLEHAVDATLYLDGEDHQGLRFLRSLKNRFGAVHQVGFFEMGEAGLAEVPDPTSVLVNGRLGEVPGAVAFPSLEGRRPMLVEVQALVTRATTSPPRRSARGIEIARLHQVLAVLERHAGLSLARHEVAVGAAGGVRIREPAVDLALAVAVASSLRHRAVGSTAVWGEIGLTGELRSVGQASRRREEAERLGFRRVVAPGSGDVAGIRQALDVLDLRAPPTVVDLGSRRPSRRRQSIRA